MQVNLSFCIAIGKSYAAGLRIIKKIDKLNTFHIRKNNSGNYVDIWYAI